MTVWICGTCGVEHPDTPEPPPGDCAICADDRQWVPTTGQEWTTVDRLANDGHELTHDEMPPGIHRFNRHPSYGIGQWTHVVRTAEGNLLWDPPNFVSDALVAAIEALGGAAAIVASHPHMYGSQVTLSHRLGGVPVLVHAADRSWVRREDDVLRPWSGTVEVLPGVTLVSCGGHFPGSCVAHVAGSGGALLAGDTIGSVAADGWVTFMRSYPNQIPLSAAVVRRIVAAVSPYPFERLYTLRGGVVSSDALGAVQRSADRYVAWVSGENDHLT